MSEANNPPPVSNTPPAQPPAGIPPPRSGWVTALMAIAGIIMLLPGVCALIFGAMSLTSPSSAAGIMPFVMVGLLVGFGGVVLIMSAIRGRAR
jgi:hypothetical protein